MPSGRMDTWTGLRSPLWLDPLFPLSAVIRSRLNPFGCSCAKISFGGLGPALVCRPFQASIFDPSWNCRISLYLRGRGGSRIKPRNSKLFCAASGGTYVLGVASSDIWLPLSVIFDFLQPINGLVFSLLPTWAVTGGVHFMRILKFDLDHVKIQQVRQE